LLGEKAYAEAQAVMSRAAALAEDIGRVRLQTPSRSRRSHAGLVATAERDGRGPVTSVIQSFTSVRRSIAVLSFVNEMIK